MFSICTIQFPSDTKVTPRCIWLSTSSTDSLLNRMFNSGILVLFDSIRALVLLGLKSTSLVFSHWSNISKSLFVSIYIKSKFFPEYDNEVSSANSFAKLPRLSVVMSLIYNKNNKGPSTDAWDTPALTRPESESSIFTNTNCLLSLKSFLNQLGYFLP